MRWGDIHKYNEGDKRFKIQFLWIPKKLHGERRWLEIAIVEQWLIKVTSLGPSGPPIHFLTWVDLKFVEINLDNRVY